MPPKKTATPAPTHSLKNKRVAFVGKFNYPQDKHKETWVKEAGGWVVPPTDEMDVLVYGEGRGGKPPGDVAKIEKRLPSVVTWSFAELAKELLPTPADIIEKAKQSEPSYEYWDSLQFRLWQAGNPPLDLSDTDFRKAHLSSAKFDHMIISGSDFTGTNCTYAHIALDHTVENAKFDGAQLSAAMLRKAKKCSFRKADLKQTWADSATYENCDFREASLTQLRGDRTHFTDCDFRAANLSDADIKATTLERCDFGKANLQSIQALKSKFIDAKLSGANLERADLREVTLKGADLRNANLRNAVLSDADLSGANVAGADFAGAVLHGANVAGVDFSKAKNYTPPAPRTAGPKVMEFAQAAVGAKDFATSAEVEIGEGEHATLSLRAFAKGTQVSVNASSRYTRGDCDKHTWITSPDVEQTMLNMADYWPNTTLRLDTVKASGSKTVRGVKLQALAVAAWAEAFGVNLAVEDLQSQKQSQQDEAARQRDELMQKICKKGASVWNGIDYRERNRIDLRSIDLSGASISGIEFTSKKLPGSKFTGADLSTARFWNSEMGGVDFTDANLTSAELQYGKCEKAVFVNANLTNANLSNTKLQGADFTGATLTGVNFEKAQFDEHTKFPKGFTIPDAVVWKGKGARPGLKAVKTVAAGSVDFPTFFAGLQKQVDSSRISKAKAMLKAERFQLFADVSDTALVGIVKSQTAADLTYSCRLASDGQFCCGTQNLRPCGGLQGALCKHLLVLIIGLAKAEQLDPAVALNWVNASKLHKPVLDADALSATFLKYKGAEAGDVDWRPTETIPEDFYAM